MIGALRRLPLRQRLMAILLETSGVVLLLTCGAFLVHEFLSFRSAALANLSTLGRVVAANSTAALAFQNADDATETLAGLAAEPHIVAAALYTREGQLFARYPAPLATGASAVPSAPGPDGYEFAGGRLIGFEPVAQRGGPRLGTLYLESDLGMLRGTLRLALATAVGVILISVLVAYLLARTLQRSISQPILALAETAASVSERHDYSVRAPKLSEDEIGRLTDAFNEMLGRIAEQDRDLRGALQAREVFIGVASHELRTPLTALRLQIHALERALPRIDNPPLRERMRVQLELLGRQADRLTQLVESLLDVTRAMSGRFELSVEEYDLRDAVLDVAARFQDQAARADCTLEVHAPEPCPGLWDRLRVEQILSNLLSNAIKFGSGKPIRVAVVCTPSQVELRVQDRGIGIAPEDHARIFERFEQASTPRPFGGLGLGLWIVRQITTAMAGSIRVSSELGSGATFTVVLPRVPANPEERSAPVATSLDEGGPDQ